jgi:hypothetical protein
MPKPAETSPQAALPRLYKIDTGVTFYHASDERAFFEWIERLPCFDCYEQEDFGLNIRLKRKPKRDELREILALGFRYGVDMRQLKAFETKANRHWFRNADAYWYQSVFGQEV